MRARTSLRAFSLLEVLVVLAVLAVLAVGYVWMLHAPTAAHRVARDLSRFLSRTRLTAVLEGRPATLIAAPSESAAVARIRRFGCEVLIAERPTVWSWPAEVQVSWPGMGLAFATDGRPRRCDGSGVGNTTILVEGLHGDRAAVIVAALGRVRWEPR